MSPASNFFLSVSCLFLFFEKRINSIKNSINLALNESYVDLENFIELKNNDEIAIIPPISGG
jgi:molybdopterin converting factor small subunit